jgi:hypothetical protein
LHAKLVEVSPIQRGVRNIRLEKLDQMNCAKIGSAGNAEPKGRLERRMESIANQVSALRRFIFERWERDAEMETEVYELD